MNKKWYSVKLIYQFIVSGEPDDVDAFYSDENDIFEESIVLVQAASFEEAYQIAEETGKNSEEIYVNEYHQTVSYQFVESLDCYLLDDTITSGIQVYANVRAVEKGTGADRFIDNQLAAEFDINSKHILIKE